MTDTAAHPSLMERAKEWFRHETHAHNARAFIPDLVAELHKLRAEVETLKADLAELRALVKKDSPAVEQFVKDAAPLVAEVAADVQKATGA